MGTFLQGFDHRFSRLDTIFFGRDGFGCNDTVACLHVTTHRRRDGAQVQGSRLFFEPLEGRPGQKSRVHIYMKDCPFF